MLTVTRNIGTVATIRRTPRVHTLPQSIPPLDATAVESFRAGMPLYRTLAWLASDADRTMVRAVESLQVRTWDAPLAVRMAIMGGIATLGTFAATLIAG